MPEEPQLNGRIASIINKLTNSAGLESKGRTRGRPARPENQAGHPDHAA